MEVQPHIVNRVKAGMALLDAWRPGWQHQIDIPKLDISQPRDCILGQLAGGFSLGAAQLMLDQPEGFVGEPNWAIAYGFDGPTRSYSSLTKEWKRQITHALDHS